MKNLLIITGVVLIIILLLRKPQKSGLNYQQLPGTGSPSQGGTVTLPTGRNVAYSPATSINLNGLQPL